MAYDPVAEAERRKIAQTDVWNEIIHNEEEVNALLARSPHYLAQEELIVKYQALVQQLFDYIWDWK